MLLIALITSLATTTPFVTSEGPAPAVQPAEASVPVVPPALLARPQDEESDYDWHGSFTLGATYVTGNADIRTGDLAFDFTKRGERDRWTFVGWWNYSEQQAGTGTGRTLNDRKAGTTGQYDYFLTERLYALGTGAADTDFQANIALRYSVGAGLGYQFVDKEKVTLSGDATLTYVNRESDAPVDGETEEDYIAIRAAYDYGHQLPKSLRFDQRGEVTPSLESDTLYARLDSRLRIDLTETFFAHIQWILNYNDPATGAELADNRVILGVGWSF